MLSFFALTIVCANFLSSCKTTNQGAKTKLLAKNNDEQTSVTQYYTLHANVINQTCLLKIDSVTTLNSISFDAKTKTLLYNLSVMTVSVSSLEAEKKSLLAQALEKNLKQNLFKKTETERFQKDEIKLCYVYVDEAGEEIVKIFFEPNEY
ncbi:MAG: hypothetical protein IKI31_05655 [Treponema sp.]|nr:hypothetical protein [Treponema sp.]